MKRIAYAGLALLSAFLYPALAQSSDPTHVKLRQQPYRTGIDDTVAQIVDALDPAPLRPLGDTGLESQLVAAAEQIARLTIRRELGRVEGARTLVTEVGDTLVARWAGDPQRKHGATWLWDTPWSTAFIFELDPSQLGPAQFPAILEDLFIWGQGMVNLTAIGLYYWPQPNGELKVSGMGRHRDQEVGMFRWWMEAVSRRSKAYLLVGMSKPFFHNLYPEDTRVPERFPPLKERLQLVSRTALFDEMGKGFKPRQSIAFYPMERDRIVLKELLSRGPLEEAELRQILMMNVDQQRLAPVMTWRRVQDFIDVAQARKEAGSYAPAFERFCLEATEGGWYQEMTITGMLASIQRNGGDFSRVALSFVERNQFARVGFYFLSQYSSSAETLQKLSNLPVRPEWQKDKEHALKRILERMPKPASQ